MPLIKPFAGLRPQAQHAAEVVAPPYDVLNAREARERAEGKPWSFLHISRPEIDLPEDTDPYSAQVYARGRENLEHMLNQNILQRDDKPVYYLYSLTMGEHIQTGIVAVASVKDYDSNRIRKHEFTRPEKEDDRVRQIDTLNAQTGPVLLAHRPDREIEELIFTLSRPMPQVEVTADDEVIHRFWVVDNPDHIKTLTERFDAMEYLYIADGHHRSAAASRVAKDRHEKHPAQHGEQAHDYFLSVIFPASQMQIWDYNRVVTDLNGLSPEQFLGKIRDHFQVHPVDSAVKPGARGEFGMYLEGKWYRLNVHADKMLQSDPVSRLDVSLLTDYLLTPVLNITDLRRDKRVDFVGGIRGLGELEKRVDSGEMTVAFSLFPTSMEDLMAVADAEEVMPPKSTWFEPKLADGLVSHVLD